MYSSPKLGVTLDKLHFLSISYTNAIELRFNRLLFPTTLDLSRRKPIKLMKPFGRNPDYISTYKLHPNQYVFDEIFVIIAPCQSLGIVVSPMKFI